MYRVSGFVAPREELNRVRQKRNDDVNNMDSSTEKQTVENSTRTIPIVYATSCSPPSSGQNNISNNGGSSILTYPPHSTQTTPNNSYYNYNNTNNNGRPPGGSSAAGMSRNTLFSRLCSSFSNFKENFLNDLKGNSQTQQPYHPGVYHHQSNQTMQPNYIPPPPPTQFSSPNNNHWRAMYDNGRWYYVWDPPPGSSPPQNTNTNDSKNETQYPPPVPPPVPPPLPFPSSINDMNSPNNIGYNNNNSNNNNNLQWDKRPNSHRCLSCVSLFICPCMGLGAMYHSLMVERSWRQGDLGTAKDHSTQAYKFSWWGIAFGLLIFFYFVFIVHEYAGNVADWMPDFDFHWD